MSNLISLVKYAPKRTLAAIAMIATAIIVPATLFALNPGEGRATFTMNSPAPYVTFNSITDNTQNIGDERNFVNVRENGSTGPWLDGVKVEKGKEYVVRMYVHNNAAANLNLVATNVTAKFVFPTKTAKSIQLDGYLSWDKIESYPNTIFDYTTFTGDKDFNLSLVSGTLDYHNNVFGNEGADLSESIFSNSGVKLGYDKLDGKIPGCLQYAGYVTFVVKPQFVLESNYSFDKVVSKHGENNWVESYNAKPGEVVDFLLEYKNTGEAQHDNVTIRDFLPAGMTYVAGSTIYYNDTHAEGAKASDNIANGTGLNLGSYGQNGNVIVTFSAKVAENDKLAECGENKLVNLGHAAVEDRVVEHTADVVVTKTCTTPKVSYTCNALNVTNLSKTSNRFTTDYTVTNAIFKNVSYVIRDANGNKVETKTTTGNAIDYNQDVVGKYSVQATITAVVDNKDVTATSNGCIANFEVTSTPVPPVTPTVLPVTGASEDIAAFLGLGSLVTTLGYYLASRRGLLNR